jgi:hypothetical protein
MKKLNKQVRRLKLIVKRFLHIHIVRQRFSYPKGCLTDKEWQELVALEYVLTWRYSDDEETDDKRYRELSGKNGLL